MVLVLMASSSSSQKLMNYIHGLLLFEGFYIAFNTSMNQLYQGNTVGETIIVAVVLMVVMYLAWCHWNIKYFKRRLAPSVSDTHNRDNHQTQSYSNETTASNRSYGHSVWTVVASILMVASIALNVFQYFTYQNDTKSIREQLSVANSTINELEVQAFALNDLMKAKNETIIEQKTEISNLQEKGRYFDDIVSGMRYGNAGYASKNFFASNSVIIVSKDDKDCKFTLTANWSNGGTVEVEYSSSAAWISFDKDEWTTSTPITVHPQSKGVTVVTFSNDVDSKTFKVLIIVTD
ncbi:MAG: hypothetical protein IJ342_00730, partial [Muribaculaceae bacterium]|nr:hypothetical protein [Muribaculaceae bacterium]